MIKIKKLLTVILISIFLTGCGYSEQKSQLTEIADISSEEIETGNNIAAGETSALSQEEKIYVYVCGAVRKPGVYEVSKDARIYQAIELAGGMTKKAQKEKINLADRMTDGQKIDIPFRDRTGEENALSQNSENQTGAPNQISEELININTADSRKLTELPGIGEAKANAIIAYREENGNFATPEDIRNVSGIGDATYENISSRITVH